MWEGEMGGNLFRCTVVSFKKKMWEINTIVGRWGRGLIYSSRIQKDRPPVLNLDPLPSFPIVVANLELEL